MTWYLNSRKTRALGILAFLLISLSVVDAHRSPATAYELSIYDSTPFLIWVGLGAALLISVILVVRANAAIGYISGILGLISWASMRVIRGHHVPGADPLVHLGIVKYIISTGELFKFFYPATHVLTAIVAEISTLSPRRSLLLTTPLFIALFISFFTLLLKRFGGRTETAAKLGFLTALLLLPINWLGVQLQPHPSSYAILLTPFAMFLLILYTRTGRIAVFGCLGVVVVLLVFVHPLIVLLLSGVVGAMAVTNLLLSSPLKNNHTIEIRSQRSYWYAVLLLGIVILFKLIATEVFQSALIATIQGFGSLFTQEATTTNRATSLNDIGVDPIVLILKWMGVSIVVGIVAMLSTLTKLYHWLSAPKPSNRLLILLAVAVLVLLPPFAIFFLSDFLLYFRILGLVMLLISFVFALGVSDAVATCSFIDGASRDYLVIAVFLLLLLFSLPIAQPSPYIAQSSNHRTEAQLSTVDVLVTYTEPSTVVTVRSHYPRLNWAVSGTRPKFIRDQAPDHFNEQNLPAAYNQTEYMLVTERDYQIDVVLYKGLRYNESDFRYLDSETGMHRIIDVGGGRIYIIPS